MKNNFQIPAALLFCLFISVFAQAQSSKPTSTKKQSKIETRDEQKREVERQKEENSKVSKEAGTESDKPKYAKNLKRQRKLVPVKQGAEKKEATAPKPEKKDDKARASVSN